MSDGIQLTGESIDIEEAERHNADIEDNVRKFYCGKTLVLMSRTTGGKIYLSMFCGKVSGANPCIACVKRRVDYLLEKIAYESKRDSLYWRIYGATTAKRTRQRLKHMAEARYLSFPLHDGKAGFIVNSAGNKYIRGDLIPADEAELRTLVQRLADTPVGKRIGGTRGTKDRFAFGGKKSSRDRKSSDFVPVYAVNNWPGVVAKCADEAGEVKTGEREDSNGAISMFYESSPEKDQRHIEIMRKNGMKVTPMRGKRGKIAP